MSIRLLNKHVNTLYRKSLNRLPELDDVKINQIYNSKRYRLLGEGISSYEGYLLCGAMSHIVSEFLSFPVEKFKYEKGKGKYFKDHVFLKHKNIIIDPTYRQMFYSPYGSGNEIFFKILYEENPPFFVGGI